MQKLLTLILVAVMLVSVLIVNNKGYDITTTEGVLALGKDLLGWMSQLGQNAWRLTGHATNMHWLPPNTTKNLSEVKANATTT